MQLRYKTIFICAMLLADIGTAHSMDVFGLSEGVGLHSEYRKGLSQDELLRETLVDLAIDKTLVSFSNKRHKASARGYETDSRINLRATSEKMIVQYQLTF